VPPAAVPGALPIIFPDFVSIACVNLCRQSHSCTNDPLDTHHVSASHAKACNVLLRRPAVYVSNSSPQRRDALCDGWSTDRVLTCLAFDAFSAARLTKPALCVQQLCVNTVLPLAPLALGRAVLVLGGLSARHDLYAAILGAYVLWAGGLLLRQIYRLSQVRTCTLLCRSYC